MSIRFLVLFACWALPCSIASAQLMQQHTETYAPSGIPWPNFSCNLFCNGPTTNVSGTVLIPKYQGPGTLVGVTVGATTQAGGSYSGFLPNPGFAGVTAELKINYSVSTGGGSPATSSTSLINTVNANQSPFISIPLPTKTFAGPVVTVPPSAFANFTGQGSISLSVAGSFKQNVFPSSGTINGSYIPGATTTVTVTYLYDPEPLGGGTVSSFGAKPDISVGGTFAAGAELVLGLTNGPPSTAAALFTAVGATTPVPLGGGLLHPWPGPILIAVATDPVGELSILAPVSPAAVAGTVVTLQFAIVDSGLPIGFVLSDGVRMTVLP